MASWWDNNFMKWKVDKCLADKIKKTASWQKGTTTLSITTFSITTPSIMTPSVMGLFVTLSINDNQHNGTQPNSIVRRVTLCWMSFCWVSRFLIIMLSVFMLNVVMLSAVAPTEEQVDVMTSRQNDLAPALIGQWWGKWPKSLQRLEVIKTWPTYEVSVTN